MSTEITWVKNTLSPTDCAAGMGLLSEAAMGRVAAFHASIPGYAPTPLVCLPRLAAYLGIQAFFVKDESFRFGLNSFKALGGSWAMANYVARRLGRPIDEMNFASLVSEEARRAVGEVTFYSATDGNHGRGVAWAARQLGQKCVIFMPRGSSVSRLENIRKEGARVSILDMNYDEAVRYAAAEAAKDANAVLVQDTDWPGYEDIPAWIMQGYGTVSREAHLQLRTVGVERPTHVFGQAGVGSFDGSLHGYFAGAFADKPPMLVTVEPLSADCIARSVASGSKTAVTGDMPTIMAGLACGEPCAISWSILRNHTRFCVSIPDWVTAKAMRVLGAPLRGDVRITSGESGASTTGLVLALLDRGDSAYAELRPLREALGLDSSSVVLTVSTEGDTFPDEYRRVVWDGDFHS